MLKAKLLILLTIIFGTVILSLTMIRSGSLYDFGIGFWGPNGHDAIWHLSLINQLKKQIPPLNPIYSGQILTNYHWGFDFFAAIISKLFFLSPIFVYFKLLPIIFALSIGILSFYLVKLVTKNNLTALLFTLFNYFAGSFGWIITLIREGKMGGESLFWSMQSASTLLNPPYALSLILLLIGFIFWIKNKNSNKFFIGVLTGVFFGLISIVKIYATIPIGIAFVLYFTFKYLQTKKISVFNLSLWISFALTSFLLLYFLGALRNSTLLEFKPFWFEHSMIESLDKLYLPKLSSLRTTLASNIVFIKLPILLAIEASLFFIFLLGNMGVRILGFWTIFQKIIKNKLNDFEILLITSMFFSLLIPHIFIQKGTAWNTIQFFYYFLFFSNFFLAQFITNIFQKHNLKNYLVTSLLIIISIIGSIATIKDYLGNPPPAALPRNEIVALNFLKNQKKGIVLTYPYDQYKKEELKLKTPIPLYLYETTAYVSAFTENQSYLEDEMNTDITGLDWKIRRNESLKFFNSTDKFFGRGFLLNNKIDYIYLVDAQNFVFQTTDIFVDKIFDNGLVKIFKVEK
ncbi:MAG: hypothetical protein Q8P53_01770 [Candidatus Shapirobacteria bacterium]|nr:hypothetical protein [Candidatus Shapirobacteria bacterium]